jgi:hypothetical protein
MVTEPPVAEILDVIQTLLCAMTGIERPLGSEA